MVPWFDAYAMPTTNEPLTANNPSDSRAPQKENLGEATNVASPKFIPFLEVGSSAY